MQFQVKQSSKLAGDNPTQQLSLTHEGDFGFTATLTMNAGAEYAGKNGNLRTGTTVITKWYLSMQV